MRKRRQFSPEFKARMVRDILTGIQSQAEACRKHGLGPNLVAMWKAAFLERAHLVFVGDSSRSAELEQVLGRMTLENEILKSYEQAGLTPSQNREMMLLLREQYQINKLCEVLGVPRSCAYYEPRPDEDRPLRDALVEIARQWPTYGYRRLTEQLKREGHVVNAKHVRRLMHELGIAGEAPPRKPRTTDSGPAFPRYPNLVDGLDVMRPDHVWVADITYIRLRKEFAYLSVLGPAGAGHSGGDEDEDS